MTKDASADILDEFIRYWGRKGNFDYEGKEIIIFDAQVSYLCAGQLKTIKTTVQFYFDGRKIELIPKEWLTPEVLYTGFDPKWQKFSLQDDQSLHIIGSGPKIKGEYKITIYPE